MTPDLGGLSQAYDVSIVAASAVGTFVGHQFKTLVVPLPFAHKGDSTGFDPLELDHLLVDSDLDEKADSVPELPENPIIATSSCGNTASAAQKSRTRSN